MSAHISSISASPQASSCSKPRNLRANSRPWMRRLRSAVWLAVLASPGRTRLRVPLIFSLQGVLDFAAAITLSTGMLFGLTRSLPKVNSQRIS